MAHTPKPIRKKGKKVFLAFREAGPYTTKRKRNLAKQRTAKYARQFTTWIEGRDF